MATDRAAPGPLETDSKARLTQEIQDAVSPATKSDVPSDSDSDSEIETNPFAKPQVAAYWKDVYEKAQYECRHAFDPTLEWTEEEEKKLIRRMDWRVCLWACIMFFGLQVDRGNLSQAVSDNMLDDLGMNTNDFNLGNIVFLLSFLLAELPSQLISKKLGPDRWIPMQITLWSIVATSQFWLSGRSSFLATRALIGMLEGGFIPDIILWLSYFYTSKELPIRLSFFWTALSVTDIATSLAAFGLLRMRGILGHAGWRWLFLVEGLITLCVGIASFFYMPASAVQTKTWFRPNGWFSEREVLIVVNRVLRDDPSKGDMHNRQAITPRRLWNCLKDYHLWPIYALGLVCFIPQAPPKTYMTLILRSLGFDTMTTNLLTIPASVMHIITLLALTWLSVKVDQRALVGILQSIWTLPCIIALRFWPGTMVNPWGTFALVTTLLSYPYTHAILVAWTSRNSNNVGNRSVSAALYNMMVQLGNVISNNIYVEADKPLYRKGNTNLLAINILAILLFLFAKAYYVWENRRRDRKWAAMTEEERREYYRDADKVRGQATNRLDFRFAH
ncbi:major facilitator superfamily domain-containing protein [Microdochium trichocladiopsis]|uniref:Major facilitator superfamily domain-containing protein n=1 Tax=Microdochium trichocladiopsis TaxID=1682393 RepID=A0A9P8XVE3_9PEZI|nr:major facilitator superfamily domain-containing protein [Microdochium trichocladiopsis]KAH7014502.1 major facilitator superfamily domain-containing protein [Microdochium trichocladiopsis]